MIGKKCAGSWSLRGNTPINHRAMRRWVKEAKNKQLKL